MDRKIYDAYVSILHKELIPAMGCTEPVAIAYAGAVARRTLGEAPAEAVIKVSGNILKNAKSVIVPNTGGLKGIKAAAAAGIVAGDPERELEVIACVTEEQHREIAEFIESAKLTVVEADSGRPLDIGIELFSKNHRASVRILDRHTNIVLIEKDNRILSRSDTSEQAEDDPEYSLLTVKDIIEFADTVDMGDVEETIERQISFNTAIAREGLTNDYGANIGKTLLSAYCGSVHNRARAWAAAGSDARMNGCEKPVIINSGSGNQGMTASLPVIVYAEELDVPQDKLYRALIVSNLVTSRLKSCIGRLSAYCGAISAGAGAGAGICYLYGGGYREISHTIVNALAINSGVICDGAKASCAAKIASAVEAGILGMEMYRHGNQFYGGDGIITKGVENTIDNIGCLARNGMAETDREILRIMFKDM